MEPPGELCLSITTHLSPALYLTIFGNLFGFWRVTLAGQLVSKRRTCNRNSYVIDPTSSLLSSVKEIRNLTYQSDRRMV